MSAVILSILLGEVNNLVWMKRRKEHTSPVLMDWVEKEEVGKNESFCSKGESNGNEPSIVVMSYGTQDPLKGKARIGALSSRSETRDPEWTNEL